MPGPYSNDLRGWRGFGARRQPELPRGCAPVQCIGFERCGMVPAAQAYRIGPPRQDRQDSRICSGRLPGLDSGESPRLSADRGAAISGAACGARHSGGPRYGPARSAVSRLHLQEENARRGRARPSGRERWKRHQGRADPRKLVFIDETCVKTDMTPLRGWAPKGERLPSAGEPRPSSAPCAMTGSTLCGFSTARPRRHRRHGHSGQPQDRCSARDDPGRGRPSSVPSALQPRPHSDQAGVRQAQALPEEGPAAMPRNAPAKRRRHSRQIQTPGMRKLPRERRIRVNLNRTRSKL